MKKIKLASILTAVALMLSSFSTVAFAVEKTGSEALKVTAEKIDWNDSKWSAYSAENYGEAFDQYMLTFTASGHSLQTTKGTGFNASKVSGTAITAYTLVVKLPENYVEGENFAMSLVSKAHDSSSPSALGNGYTYMIGNGTTPMIPAAGEARTVGTADELEIAKVIVSLVAGDSTTVSFENTQVIIQDISNNAAVDDTDIQVLPKVSGISLPVVEAPTEPTITEGTGKDVTTGVNGKVWNDVTVENVALGTDYKAVFTYNKGEADEDTAEFAISGLEGDEVNGNATFAVILKTAKDVSKIVMDIICEVAGK